MTSPLDPYLHRTPTPEDFVSVPTDELARIVEAASEVESLSSSDVSEARTWARNVRTAAERALELRK